MKKTNRFFKETKRTKKMFVSRCQETWFATSCRGIWHFRHGVLLFDNETRCSTLFLTINGMQVFISAWSSHEGKFFSYSEKANHAKEILRRRYGVFVVVVVVVVVVFVVVVVYAFVFGCNRSIHSHRERQSNRFSGWISYTWECKNEWPRGEIRNRASQREPNIAIIVIVIVIVVIRSVVIVNFVSASSQTLNKEREWNFDGAQEKTNL